MALCRVQEDWPKPAGESRRVISGGLWPKAETKVWGLEISTYSTFRQHKKGKQEDKFEYSKEYTQTTTFCCRFLLTLPMILTVDSLWAFQL